MVPNSLLTRTNRHLGEYSGVLGSFQVAAWAYPINVGVDWSLVRLHDIFSPKRRLKHLDLRILSLYVDLVLSIPLAIDSLRAW